MMTIADYVEEIPDKSTRTFHDPAQIKYLLPTDSQGNITKAMYIHFGCQQIHVEFHRLIKQHKALKTTLNG